MLHLDEGVDFIKTAITKEEPVLVHCNAGVSRSASFVIAYFIREEGMTFREALTHVVTRRPSVMPNLGFQKQLEQYYKVCADKKREMATSGKKESTDTIIKQMFSQPPPMTMIETAA